jgi:hypothetical protein
MEADRESPCNLLPAADIGGHVGGKTDWSGPAIHCSARSVIRT